VDQINTCSKCTEPAVRSLLVPVSGSEVRIIRLCSAHWAELEALLPVAA
jgi:hypothetical protein